MKKTFTLIEMLIVVVIIGILAAALIPRLQSVQARARDTKRKADLHQIATALEIYKQDNGSYSALKDEMSRITDGVTWESVDARPITDPEHATMNYNEAVVALRTIIERYMTSIPLEPNMSSVWHSGPVSEIFGYLLAVLPRRGTSLDSLVLAARTESDGSSSNWVSNDGLILNGDSTTHATITGDGTNWIGSIAGYAINTDTFRAQVYDDYLCSKVTFDSGTTNEPKGTCTADKNGDDLRYLYVQ